LSEEAAYQWLRDYSMKKRIALVTVSEFILKNNESFSKTSF